MARIQNFSKYSTLGAYHWEKTYGLWKRSSPRAHAYYDLALSKVSESIDISSTLGLDIGCGEGVLLYKIALRRGRAIGIDPVQDCLKLGHQLFLSQNGYSPWLIQGSGYEIPLRSESIGYVISIEVIEHLKEPQPYLEEVKRVLISSGIFALTTPNKDYLFKKVIRSSEVQDPYHQKEYSPIELKSLLASIFSDVIVMGQFPYILNELYSGVTRFMIIDKGIRFGFKVLHSMGYNPFLRWISQNPDQRWHGLLAVCRK